MKILYVFATVMAVWHSASAYATDIRFGIDPSVDLASLKAAATPANMSIPVQQNGKLFQLDGSAVLHECDAAHGNCSIDKIWYVAKDYNDYVKFGMPDLKQSVVMPGSTTDGTDVIYAWIDMVAFGVDSSSYLEVHTAPTDEGLSADSRGIYWVTDTQIQSGWTYPSRPAFADFHGSWYMQDLGGGDIYVRYYLSATAKSILGTFLIGPRLQSDAQKTVVALWQQAISASLQVPAQND